MVKFLAEKEWLLGYITIVDFWFYEILQYVKGIFEKDFNGYKTLVDFVARFENLPKIKEYHASNRYLKAPFLTPGRS